MSDSKVLEELRPLQQVETLWCWAAVAAIIDDYYSRIAAPQQEVKARWQCELVAAVIGETPPSCNEGGNVPRNHSLNKCNAPDLGLPGCWNLGANVENFESLALSHTRYAQMNGQPEPYDDNVHARVRSEIDEGRPVVIRLVLNDQDESEGNDVRHFNVIYGYIGTHFYYLADPADGSAGCRAISEIEGWKTTVFTEPRSPASMLSSGSSAEGVANPA